MIPQGKKITYLTREMDEKQASVDREAIPEGQCDERKIEALFRGIAIVEICYLATTSVSIC
jgi:hypothetical protein